MAQEEKAKIQEPGTGLRGWVKALFVLSLTLNVVVAGVVVGGIIGHERSKVPHPVPPEELTFGPLTGAFSPADRDAMRKSAKLSDTDLQQMRATVRGDFTRLTDALGADPWDEAAVRDVLTQMRDRSLRRMDLGEEVMLDRLRAMSPDERQAFAKRLLDGVTRFERHFDPRGGRRDDD